MANGDGDPITQVLQAVSHPAFNSMSPSDQRSLLTTLDPKLGDLSSTELSGMIPDLQKKAVTRPDIVKPPQPAGAGVTPQEVYNPEEIGTYPMTNLADYGLKSAGRVYLGLNNIAQGDKVKGTNQIIDGVIHGAIPPAIGAVGVGMMLDPADTIRTVGWGYARAAAAGYVAQKGTEMAGGTKEQQELAGKVGALAGGATEVSPRGAALGLVKGLRALTEGEGWSFKGAINSGAKAIEDYMTKESTKAPVTTAPSAAQVSEAAGYKVPAAQYQRIAHDHPDWNESQIKTKAKMENDLESHLDNPQTVQAPGWAQNVDWGRYIRGFLRTHLSIPYIEQQN